MMRGGRWEGKDGYGEDWGGEGVNVAEIRDNLAATLMSTFTPSSFRTRPLARKYAPVLPQLLKVEIRLTQTHPNH